MRHFLCSFVRMDRTESPHTGYPHHWSSAPAKHGVCVVSPDYRLAPQARMPQILTDCANVMKYLRSQEFAEATGGRVDAERICVSGGSAGVFALYSRDPSLMMGTRRLACTPYGHGHRLRGLWYRYSRSAQKYCCHLSHIRPERSVRLPFIYLRTLAEAQAQILAYEAASSLVHGPCHREGGAD